MKLADLSKFPHFRGFKREELFDNGYGISVIPENVSGDEPLYEIAVLAHNNGKKARIVYDTGVTNDVIRYCTEAAVNTFIERIRSLPEDV